MSMGIVCGETRRAPFSRSTSHCPISVSAPPMPVAMATPSRSPSTSGEPASAQASRAAMRASCSVRSSLRASTRSMTSRGSTATDAAMRTGSTSAHSSSRYRTPERPASSPSQVDGTSPPTGVDAPSPVTTTVRRPWELSVISGAGLRDVSNGVADGAEVLDVVVGDLDVELLLGGDNHLDHRQGVDVQVVDERLVELHVGRGHAGNLVHDLGEAGQDLLLGGHGRFSFGWGLVRRGPGGRV